MILFCYCLKWTTQTSKSGFKVLLYSNLQEFMGKSCFIFHTVKTATQIVCSKASYSSLLQKRLLDNMNTALKG